MNAASALIFGMLLTPVCVDPQPCDPAPSEVKPAGEARSSLVLAGDWLGLDTGGDGGEFRADWVYRGAGGVLQAGYSNYRLSGAKWSLGRLGFYQRWNQRAAWSGELQLGPGRSAGERFTYGKYRLGLTLFASPDVMVFVDDQYLRIAGADLNLLSGGVQWHRGDWSLKGTLMASTGGSAGPTRFGYGRVERKVGQVRLFGGAGGGRSAPEAFDLADGGGGSIRQFFGGAVIRRGAWDVILSIDYLDQTAADRLTVGGGVRIPLR